MPRLRAVGARLAGGLTVAVVVALAGCSSSEPAALAPTGSAAAVQSDPAPTETLLGTPESDGSTVGSLADGFPADLLPVPAGATVLVSSVEPVPTTDLVQISLNLRTAQDTDGLMGAVRAPLLAAGFVEGAPPVVEPGLAAQSTFSRADGTELLVVGVLDRDGERTLTLGGKVRAAVP
ncbi:hypothetical protein Cch01nite_12560 [Cellulomonas chitinilytica]|uniref:GerMN domain-containing protein n=1 Tax=Cellulomonas chitinilytica TaxID=398759 RepID=A0A919NZP3_9CELL|nr:hypothetical protein [Cellulomonas chitinilytica]GIG20532.1 hypothetical protein Cch01nite_12560 [Cellulomonas chitinilytica]